MRAAWADPRGRWLLAAAALVVAAAVLVWGRGWLGERLLPDPRLNRRLEQGQAALQAGKLSAADGSGARELFESVLAVDPDQMQARQGLLAVRQAAVARAQAALSARRLREAETQLALAHALSAPQVELQPLQARLRDLREANADLGALLAQAAAPEIDEDRALQSRWRPVASPRGGGWSNPSSPPIRPTSTCRPRARRWARRNRRCRRARPRHWRAPRRTNVAAAWIALPWATGRFSKRTRR